MMSYNENENDNLTIITTDNRTFSSSSSGVIPGPSSNLQDNDNRTILSIEPSPFISLHDSKHINMVHLT